MIEKPVRIPLLIYMALTQFLSSRLFAWLGIAVFFYLVVWRVPEQLLVPSLFMEQATVYYKYGFEHSWLDAMLAPHQGYYSLWTNLVTLVAARYFPLAHAPYVIMLGGFLIGVLLVALVFMPGSPLTTPVSRVLALWLMALIPPSNDRFLLNYCHFYTCVAAVLVLLSEAHSTGEVLFQRRVLVFSVLTGPVVVFLMPVFLLAYGMERRRERLIQLGILSAGAMVQAAAYFYSLHHDLNTLTYANGGSRFNGLLELDAFLFWLFNRSLIHPYGGWEMMVPVGWFLEGITASGGMDYLIVLLCSAVGVAGFLILLHGERGTAYAHRQLWLVVSFLCLSYGIFVSGAVPGNSKAAIITAAHRYFVAQSMLIGIAFAMHFAHARQQKIKIIYGFLILVQLLIGWDMWRHYAATLPPQISWEYQTRLWERNPWHDIRIMPPGHTFRLDPPLPEDF
jgi:hypothetical protein